RPRTLPAHLRSRDHAPGRPFVPDRPDQPFAHPAEGHDPRPSLPARAAGGGPAGAVARRGHLRRRRGPGPRHHDLPPTGGPGARARRQGLEVVGRGSDLDVTDRAAVEAALDSARPELVINTTAYHVVPDCEAHPERAFAVNTAAVKVLAELCGARQIAFATYST